MSAGVDSELIRKAKRRLIEMHYCCKACHLGGNLSCIDAMLFLHHEAMRPQDKFVLSKGHSAGAYYVTLWSMGRLSDAELDTFHQDNTRLSGHPPTHGIDDVLFATGSLGHGLGLAAGLALAAKLKNSPARVFCLTSDGEWQEGSTLEALIFAAHHKLDNLVILVDQNGLQGFGSTAEVASMHNLAEKLSGFGVSISSCDGHDIAQLRGALAQPNGDNNRPRMIILNTRKGNGVPDFEGKMDSHYLKLTEVQYQAALARLL